MTEIEALRQKIKGLEQQLQDANALFMDLIGMPGMDMEIRAIARKRRNLHKQINRACRRLERLQRGQRDETID